MLYIFDLGNVIVDIDFNRVLGTWSDLSRTAGFVKAKFHHGEAFHQHERGEITDEALPKALCHDMALPLSYEQFSHGWQAVLPPCALKSSTSCKSCVSRGIGWSSCRIPTVCTPRFGRTNTLRSVRLLTIFTFPGSWHA